MINNSGADTAASSVKYLETPDKSLTDKKEYKCLVLANGLKVLLVADNKTGISSKKPTNLLNNEPVNEKLSAVALMVDVGAFSQPRKFQGLAHFLEHMIFMGSKKYPKENAFDALTTKYGGSNNACTNCEETVYHFQVPEQHLDISIDCFASQLKEPLMLEDSMTREREAVESEYRLVLNNDEVRRQQLIQSLASENSPYKCFIWGNLKTLKEDIENDEELHKVLKEFYSRHYSAHRIIACIQSCLTLPELEQLAIKHFADMKSNELPGLDFSQYKYQLAFRREFYEEVFFVKPIENVCKLDLTWVLPPTLKYYKCKPAEFFSFLLGYEGEGSLCAYLRKRLWAVTVMAGSEPNPMFTSFNLSITLTELGFKHLDEVLAATFSYVKLFNNVNELKDIYQELSFIKDSDFRYAIESAAVDNVQAFVRYGKHFPTKDLLTGSELYYEYSEEQVQNIIDHFNEFHFNIMLTSQQQYEDVVYDKKEKYFGAEYTSRKLPKKWLDLWQNSKPIAELFVPKANPFIAHDFSIYWLDNGKKELSKFPEKILQTETFELWFRQDDKFNLPHGNMNFYLMSPLIRQSPRNIVLCSLYLDLVQHLLVEELYPATIASINYGVYCAEKGIVISVGGYNEKLNLVVELIIKGIIATKDHFNESQLEMYKKQQQKNYFNALIKPELINTDLHSFILKHNCWLLIEKQKYINDINVEDIKTFANEFTQELYVQALMQGNLEQETAVSTMNTVMERLNCEALKEKSCMEERGTELPLGFNKILCHNLNPKDGNTIVANFYQIGPRSLRDECILNLLIMILESPIYNTLRTQEQLGYVVSCYSDINNGIMGYYIYVNSQETKHNAHYVDERIEAFRSSIQQLLEQLSLEDFQNFKNSLIKLKEVEDITLGEEMVRNWTEINTEEYLFERVTKEIEILYTLEKHDILDFWLTNENNNLRKLSVQVIGSSTDLDNSTSFDETDMAQKNLALEFLDCDKNGNAIVNIEEFKANLPIYPVIKTKI